MFKHLRRPQLTALLVLVPISATLPALCGCGDDSPKPVITIATNCPKGQIGISTTATKTQLPSTKWIVKLEVKITCNERPVLAHIKVQAAGGWWTQEYNTNPQGELSVSGPAKDGNPGGQSITVNVDGKDGQAEKTVTVQ